MGCKFKLEFTLQRGRNKLKLGLQQRFFLRGEQFADARLAERKQIGKLRLGERGLLAGALNFDEFTGGIHHEVHVHRRGDVFGVAQVEQRRAVDDADADGGDAGNDRAGGNLFLVHQFCHRERERDERTGDGRGARAAVGLEHVAIHPDGAFAQFVEVKRGAHGAADEPLDFLRPSVNFSLRTVALLPLQRGVREHRVFGGDPAARDFLFLHPAWHGFLDGHAANDARVAPFDERRAGGIGRDVILKTQRTELIGSTTVGAQG